MSPDLIIYPLPDSKITIGVANKILNFRNNITTFVIGPGMVNQKMNGLIKLVLGLENKNINIILDAGAINQELIDSVDGKNIVVTAHLGEFKKLINKELNNENEIKNELLNYAKNRNLISLTFLLFEEVLHPDPYDYLGLSNDKPISCNLPFVSQPTFLHLPLFQRQTHL